VPRYEHPWRCQITYSTSKVEISWITVSEFPLRWTEKLDDGMLDDDSDIPPSWSLYLQSYSGYIMPRAQVRSGFG
jgi:hypothetical protein